MKRLIFMLMLLVLANAGYASDRAGQDNVTELADMLTQLYDEVLPTTSTPNKMLDTTTATNLLNWAAENAAEDLYCVERDTTIVIAADTYWYSLPSDFYDIPPALPTFGAVGIDGNNGLEYGMKPMSVAQMGFERPTSATTEIPARYLIRKKEIYIEPVNTSGDSVRLYYAAYANELDSVGGADTTNIDREYIEYVILKAAEKYLMAVNWGSKQDYVTSRLGIVQAKLMKEEKRLGVTRQSTMDDMVR